MEEVWVLRVMFLIVVKFLAGSVLPLDFFPVTLQTILSYTPFPYLTFYPIQLFSGDGYDRLLGAVLTLCFWTGLLVLFTKFIWQRGLRMYTAAGM